MKNTKLILAMIASTLLVFTACEKSEVLLDNAIDGTYIGSITSGNGTKSTAALAHGDHDATADITNLGDGQIMVHCYGSELDTTFMLNYYHNNDSVNVCLTGEAFEQMYGHMMGQGGMMNGSTSGNLEWMNHMNTNHSDGDEHFGGFDLTKSTFGYTITNEVGEYHFQGKKQ